jgi:acyl transferase domain-containing protein
VLLSVLDTDKKLFRIGEKEAQFMQPSQCWTLEAVFRAIENAGIKLEQLQGTRYIWVYVSY